MKNRTSLQFLLILSGWLGFFNSSTSFAVLTDNLTIGNAKAIALGHAVTAEPMGIDSIHYNPAGLTKLNGRYSHYKIISGDFGIELEFGESIPRVKSYLERKQNSGTFPDGFFYDESKNVTSKTNGATLMLPFAGMTDLPLLLGATGGMSYSPDGSNFTFATGVYTPLAVGFNRKDTDPGRFIGSRLSLVQITYLAPTVAYQWTDTLSIGASFNASYAGVGLDLNFRGPHVGMVTLWEFQDSLCPSDGSSSSGLCGGRLGLYDELGELSVEVEDPAAFGFNLGLMWEPNLWFSLGLAYQSTVKTRMKGTFNWTSTDTWVNFLEPLLNDPLYTGAEDVLALMEWSLPEGKPNLSGEAFLNMDMPEHLALGIAVKVTPKIQINLDYKYTTWSSWPALPLKFSEPIDVLRLAEIVQPEVASRDSVTFPFGLTDSSNVALGLTYSYSSRLKLRAGYENRPSSIPKQSETPLLPVGDGHFYGAGFSYEFESISFDFGMAYFASEVKMKGGDSRLGNSTNPSLVIYNPFPGTDITARLSMFLLEMSFLRKF